MDWFLYDRDPRHERANDQCSPCVGVRAKIDC